MELSTSTNIGAFLREGSRGPKNDVFFCIELCAKAGYKILDINFCEAMNPNSPMRGNNWEAYVREIARAGEEYGIRFTQSHLPYYDIFGNGDQLMEELIRRSIYASGMLGVTWAVTHPGTYYDAGHDMSVSLQKNLSYFAPHVKTAEEAGIGIALENDFEYNPVRRRIFCSSVYELCELADAFHSDSVGVCYDFGHANLTGGYHRQNLNVIKQRLKAVHVQDNYGEKDDHNLPFFGCIDWEDAMAGLADIGYQGELTYEIQEFARYLPNELKYAAVELSVKVGNYLIGLYNKALENKKIPGDTV